VLHRVLRHFSLAALLLAAVLLGVAASASAAIVANGDFEAGSLEGWTHAEQPGGEGAWFAYSRTQEKGGLLTPGPPPSGEWAAGVSNSLPTPETSYLYQNVTLPPASSDRLSMYLYYSAFAPISVPTPNSLFTSESPLAPPNQQVRVDVLRPNAPLESLSPNDVLATVYASKPGDPEVLEPTVLSADLSALAGQTVRLRIAVAVQDGPMEVGVDGVTIESSPLASTLPAPPTPPPAPSNFFAAGKLARDRRHGSARLAVTVPGPGTLSVFDARHKVAIASVRHNPNERPILIRTAAVQTGGAQTVRLPIRPTWAAKKLLAESGRLRFRLQLTFTPVGGLAATKGYMGTLVRKLRRGRR
jgi:hypothetical protein